MNLDRRVLERVGVIATDTVLVVGEKARPIHGGARSQGLPKPTLIQHARDLRRELEHIPGRAVIFVIGSSSDVVQTLAAARAGDVVALRVGAPQPISFSPYRDIHLKGLVVVGLSPTAELWEG